MRPPGEIRQAVLGAARGFARERAHTALPGAVWREVAAQLVPHGIAPRAVRDTWKNLVRAGQLCPVGQVRVPGSARALLACAPAGPASAAVPEVGAVVSGWVGVAD